VFGLGRATGLHGARLEGGRDLVVDVPDRELRHDLMF